MHSRLFIGLLIGVTISAFAEEAPPDTVVPLCEKVQNQTKQTLQLCANNHYFEEGACCETTDWFILHPNGNKQPLQESPNSMIQIVNFQASPSYAFLAILSVGEGHPMIDIVDLPEFLQDKPTKPILTLNPYPGTIMLEKWQGEQLVVSSDRLLSYQQTDKDGSIDFPLGMSQAENFAIEPRTGKIIPLGPNAQNPIAYYTQLLHSRDESEVEEAQEALKLLKK